MTPPPERFAPPQAVVADLTPADVLLAARPRGVVWAVGLLLVSLAASVVSMLPFVDPPMANEPVAMTALIWGGTLVLAAIELWLLRCVWRRRNWARWVMVTLIVASIVLSLPTIEEDGARSALVAWLGIATLALGAVAAGLLLWPSSARWFTAARSR
jgi:hypothetical protein